MFQAIFRRALLIKVFLIKKREADEIILGSGKLTEAFLCKKSRKTSFYKNNFIIIRTSNKRGPIHIFTSNSILKNTQQYLADFQKSQQLSSLKSKILSKLCSLKSEILSYFHWLCLILLVLLIFEALNLDCRKYIATLIAMFSLISDKSIASPGLT